MRSNSSFISFCEMGGSAICLETEVRFEKEFLLNLRLSPLGSSPFSARVRVLHSWPSRREGFSLAVTSFEDLTVGGRQNLLELLSTISLTRKQMSD